MKINLFKYLILVYLFMVAPDIGGKTFQDSSIIGSWYSEKDTNWKIEFDSKGLCNWYYKDELTGSYSYSIGNSSPWCGQEVPVENNTSYLMLNRESDGDQKCYEINGITDETLSLRFLGRGGYMLFSRKK